MKKFIIYLLALVLVFSLVACGGTEEPAAPAESAATTESVVTESVEAQPEVSTEPTVELVQENVFAYVNSINSNIVLYTAEYVNTSSVPISVGDISIDLEDTSGSLISSKPYVSAYPSNVMPGESFYISESLLDVFDETTDLSTVGNAIVHYTLSENPNHTAPTVTISEQSMNADALMPSVMGRVENTGTEAYDNLMLYIPVWSADGKLATVAVGMVEALNPGDKKGFDQGIIEFDPSIDLATATFEVIPSTLF